MAAPFRNLFPFTVALFAIAACGGGGSNKDHSGGNFAQDIRFGNTSNTNATTTRITSQSFGGVTFNNTGTGGKTGTVNVSFGTVATTQRNLIVTVTDPNSDIVAEEIFSVGNTGMAAAVTYTERSGATVRTWNAVSGTIRAIFKSNQQLALELNNVRFQPVASTSATGTFTINGKVRGEVD